MGYLEDLYGNRTKEFIDGFVYILMSVCQMELNLLE